ncbi:PQQ-binding-like beta-propeller repeat protein [Nocardioides speluncae]|uniref:outer membrane protein assembly factor BamB family protein n=1 Tax=Nocardioides speluncae TaxID=2670337 RepID=UPI00198193ED|nr:PQQ-binding-like beta-propeller repeat protein [Nocardioides speluncae]
MSTLTVAVALLVSACSGGSEDKPSPDKTPPAGAATLEPAWEESGGQPVWLTDDFVVTNSQNTLVALDLDDGTEQWSTPAPDGLTICATSPEVNDDGLAGLLLGNPGQACETAAAIDTSTGDVKWTQQFENPLDLEQPTDAVSVGDDALVAVSCATARFSLADGGELEPFFEDDTECVYHEAVAAEGTVIIKEPDGGESNIDLVAYDGDTGEELWRRPADRSDEPYEIVNLEPLVLDILEEGVPAIRTVDDEGNLGAELGRQNEGYSGQRAGIAKVIDNKVVVAELGKGDRSMTVYDIATGDEVGSRALGKDERLIGLYDDGILTERPAADDSLFAAELLYSELTDLDQVSLLGRGDWRPGFSSYAVAGDRLIVSPPNTIAAIPIPAEEGRKPVDAP